MGPIAAKLSRSLPQGYAAANSTLSMSVESLSSPRGRPAMILGIGDILSVYEAEYLRARAASLPSRVARRGLATIIPGSFHAPGQNNRGGGCRTPTRATAGELDLLPVFRAILLKKLWAGRFPEI